MKSTSILKAMQAAAASLLFPATTFLGFPFLARTMSDVDFAQFLVLLAFLRILSSIDLGIASLVTPRIGNESDKRERASILVSSLSLLGGWAFVVWLGGASILLLLDAVGAPVSFPTHESYFWICVTALGYQVHTALAGLTQLLDRRRWLIASATLGALLYIVPILAGEIDTPMKAIGVIAVQYFAASSVCLIPVVRTLGTTSLSGIRRIAQAPSLWMQMTTLGGMLSLQSPILIADRILDRPGVVGVGIGQQYGSVVRLGALSLAGYFVAEIASLSEADHRKALAFRLARTWRLVTLAVGIASSAGALIIVPIWMGEDLAIEVMWASAASAATSSLIASTLVHTSYLRAAQHQRVEASFVLSLLAGTVVAALLCAMIIGTAFGVWLGAMAGAVIGAVYLSRAPCLSGWGEAPA